MKTSYIIGLLLISLSLASDELKWVDTQIDAIKPSREGLTYANISSLKDPIIFLNTNKTEASKKSKTTSPVRRSKRRFSSTNSIVPRAVIKQQKFKTSLVLEAIINKSALISGNWYKLNDTVRSYKLSKVNRTSVVLSRNNQERILSTRAKTNTLKFNK